MGYYTDYTLHWQAPDDARWMGPRDLWAARHAKGAEALKPETAKLIAFEAVLNEHNVRSSTEGKWYAYHDDMLSLSKSLPGYLFVLLGQGEETGDVWRKFYTAGNLIRHDVPGWPTPPDGWPSDTPEPGA
jgi:hypothetical protein